jgi:methionine--tRNA ligase beta chain
MNDALISIDDFKKLDIRIGEIKSAEKVPDTDKLLRLTVDMGEEKPRQIISGIAAYFPDPSELVGVKCAFAANLEPRVIRGLESQGMILAAGGGNPPASPETSSQGGPFTLLRANADTPPGSKIK